MNGDGLKETLLDDTAQPASGPMNGSALPPGARVGRYTILERIGAGGMGVVYAAHDPELDRKVAIKLLRPEATKPDTQGRTRLLREAQAIARLPHPNVVAVYDVGTLGDQVFVAMEFVDGQTLGAWARQKRRSVKEILGAYLQAGRALAAAHALGIIHRDFKPDNALIDTRERVRVLDFGLARAAGETSPAGEPVATPPALADTLTRTGAVLGTPGYMAPEQHEGRPADARTDQFSFCVALYEALYGERPFAGSTLAELASAVRAGRRREAPRDVRVPAKVRNALLRGLETDPDRRFESMDELLRVLSDDSARRRQMGVVVATLAIVAVGIGIAEQRRGAARLCKNAADKLTGAWDDAVRGRVRSAFLATGRPYATVAAQQVEHNLDQYASAWVGMHTDACEATHARAEQSAELFDLRMECLSLRRDALATLTDLFAHADGKLVQNAVQAVGRLPAIDDCGNSKLLKASVQPALDPTVRAQLEPLRQAMARTRAIEAAGHYKDALAEAEKLQEQTRGVDYRPLQAESLLLLGSIHASMGNSKAAHKTLGDAVLAADACHHDDVAARAATQLVRLVGFDEAHTAEGDQWVSRAHAAIEALGGSERLEAELLNNEGVLLINEGKADAALVRLARSLAMRERLFGPKSAPVAVALGNLAMLYNGRGDYEQAIDEHRRALAIEEEVLGPNHPRLSSTLVNLGNALAHSGQYEEALAAHRRGLAVAEASGVQEPGIAASLNNVGSDLYTLHQYDEALAIFRRVQTMLEKAYGREHPDVALAQSNVGASLAKLGRWQEATAALEHARDVYARLSGPDSVDAAETIIELADLLRSRGRCREALAMYTKMQTVVAREMGADHPVMETVLVGLADCQATAGNGAAAIELADEARAIEDKRKLPRDQRGATELVLAKALWAAGRKDEARRTATQARADLATHPSPEAPREADAWLARHR